MRADIIKYNTHNPIKCPAIKYIRCLKKPRASKSNPSSLSVVSAYPYPIRIYVSISFLIVPLCSLVPPCLCRTFVALRGHTEVCAWARRGKKGLALRLHMGAVPQSCRDRTSRRFVGAAHASVYIYIHEPSFQGDKKQRSVVRVISRSLALFSNYTALCQAFIAKRLMTAPAL